MRIYPISVVQPTSNLKHVQKAKSSPDATLATHTFKGWKAGLGSLIGAGAGIAIGTALTGGILVPFLLGGTGSIAGGIFGSSKEDNSDNDLPDLNDDSTPDWHMRD